jgi:hypothetical protein
MAYTRKTSAWMLFFEPSTAYATKDDALGSKHQHIQLPDRSFTPPWAIAHHSDALHLDPTRYLDRADALHRRQLIISLESKSLLVTTHSVVRRDRPG